MTAFGRAWVTPAKVQAGLWRLAPLLLLLSIWQAISMARLFPAVVLIPPAKVFQTFLMLLRSGELGRNIEASGVRVLAGYAIGAALGLAFGTLMGVFTGFERYVRLIFNTIRQIPSIAWVPILMVIFGFQETFKIVLIAKAAFFPVALNTLDGIRTVPRAYLEVTEIYGLSRLSVLRKLILPSALPSVATGLRLGLSRAWMVLVAAELFASSVGIGHMMDWGRQLFHIDIVMVGVVVTAVTGFLLDAALRRLEARLTPWKGAAA